MQTSPDFIDDKGSQADRLVDTLSQGQPAVAEHTSTEGLQHPTVAESVPGIDNETVHNGSGQGQQSEARAHMTQNALWWLFYPPPPPPPPLPSFMYPPIMSAQGWGWQSVSYQYR